MIVDEIDFKSLTGGRHTFKLRVIETALNDYWRIPIMVIKAGKGPTLGITAALHGNELNGVSIIHNLWNSIRPQHLNGTIIFAPILNGAGFMRTQREFYDGTDLNRIMPGKKDGNTSEAYAYTLIEKLIKNFDYFIDLHTASFGRINSLYVRADMGNEITAKMAKLQEPQIIVNKPGEKGTLRRAAADLGIHSITVEIGDPNIFQTKYVRSSIFGLKNVLVELGMLEESQEDIHQEPIMCKSSYWVRAQKGGILRVTPHLTEEIKKGERVATIHDIFGALVDEIYCPEDAIVVAKSTNPVCHRGSRIIHLGIRD